MMTEERLNNCFLMHVHKDITDTLDSNEIAKDFVMIAGRILVLLVFINSDFLIAIQVPDKCVICNELH